MKGKMEPVEAHIVVHGIAEKDGRLLLVQEKNGTWSLPSGSVELGETILDTIIREVKEETGAKCQPIGLFITSNSREIHNPILIQTRKKF